MVNPMVEKPPSDASVFTRERKSSISGTEKAAFSAPIPRALCRM